MAALGQGRAGAWSSLRPHPSTRAHACTRTFPVEPSLLGLGLAEWRGALPEEDPGPPAAVSTAGWEHLSGTGPSGSPQERGGKGGGFCWPPLWALLRGARGGWGQDYPVAGTARARPQGQPGGRGGRAGVAEPGVLGVCGGWGGLGAGAPRGDTQRRRWVGGRGGWRRWSSVSLAARWSVGAQGGVGAPSGFWEG